MKNRISVHLANSKKLPEVSGVYRMLDSSEKCIYVGKAKNLRKRVSSYFSQLEGQTRKTQLMVSLVNAFEITTTSNENEALILESNLIKSLKPRYNILLRDDKSYPFIHLENKHSFPRIKFHRGSRNARGRFFGPFPNVYAVRETLNMIQKLFKIRQCDESFFRNRNRACLQYQIKRCSGPCVGLIDEAEYKADVDAAVMVLEGRNKEVVERLNKQMELASFELQFERAAKFRDQIRNLSGLQLTQTADKQKGEVDATAVCMKAGLACVQVFFIRQGRVLGSKSYFPTNADDTSEGQVLTAFLKQFYLTGHRERQTPSEVLVNSSIEGVDSLENAITQTCHKNVRIKRNVRGDRAKWLKMAVENAKVALEQRLASSSDYRLRLAALSDVLNGGESLERLECFDISHLGGESTVASCVVFDKEGPKTSEYRKFNIKDAKPGDDYAAMAEALNRRYRKIRSEGGIVPDVLIVDGGKGQIKFAAEVISELQLPDVRLLGIAKGRSRKPGLETIFYAEEGSLKSFRPKAGALLLLQHIRDEAHRFAIDAHRKSRAKQRKKSKLEEIEGIGAKRRQSLLKYFGGFQGILEAGISDLERVPGISEELAKRIHGEIKK